jgi:hypothetical protein
VIFSEESKRKLSSRLLIDVFQYNSSARYIHPQAGFILALSDEIDKIVSIMSCLIHAIAIRSYQGDPVAGIIVKCMNGFIFTESNSSVIGCKQFIFKDIAFKCDILKGKIWDWKTRSSRGGSKCIVFQSSCSRLLQSTQYLCGG